MNKGPYTIASCERCSNWYVSYSYWNYRFCSNSCRYAKYRTGEEIMGAFAKMFRVADGCWEWIGGKVVNGYGVFSLNEKCFRAPRFALHIFCGVPLRGYECAMHSCDNPGCVNPDHLNPGTTQENRLDSVAKLRAPLGSRHPKSKLTEDKVREMRSRRTAGEGISALAREFGISQTTASGIFSGTAWKHIL